MYEDEEKGKKEKNQDLPLPEPILGNHDRLDAPVNFLEKQASLQVPEQISKKQEITPDHLHVPEQVQLYERLSFKGFEHLESEIKHKKHEKLNECKIRPKCDLNLSRKPSIKPEPGTVKSLVKIFEMKSDDRTRTKRSVSCISEVSENEENCEKTRNGLKLHGKASKVLGLIFYVAKTNKILISEGDCLLTKDEEIRDDENELELNFFFKYQEDENKAEVGLEAEKMSGKGSLHIRPITINK